MFYILLAMLSDAETIVFNKIYEQYSDRIYCIAHSILMNHHDAEDAHNDVMIKIIKNIERFSKCDANETEAQIVIYTRNTSINIYNKNKRDRRHTVQTEISNDYDGDSNFTVELADKQTDVETAVINQENIKLVMRHINELPESQRDAIILVLLFGYSNTEAAEALNITSNSVRQRIFVGRQKLIKMLGEKV